MLRVCVIGTSGSGKTTLAKDLSRLLGCPWLELDSVYHQAGWTPLDAGEFRRRVSEAAAGPSWVIDGGYSAVSDILWARADTVVWIDLPRRTIMRRIIWRTVRRMARRTELWNGNREQWRNLFTWDPEKSVIAWAWRTYPDRRERYTAAMADPVHGHLRFVRLSTPAAVRRFLRDAAPASGVD